jgi:sugar phosphate isomerase/epimerase
MKTTRRKFLKNSGTALASAALLSMVPTGLLASGLPAGKRSFGFQTWTLREKLVADFPGTLKEMADLGYSEVEMCSPLGYSNSGFGPLNGMSGKEMNKIIGDAGLKCTSSHFNVGELRDSMDNRLEWASQLGMKQMVLASFWLPEDASLDDFRKAAQELNGIGSRTKTAGIQMAYHNHHMEFKKLEGKLIYDVLLEEFDPELVKMQFQVAVVNIGYHAANYFRKFPGRFISAHLADWSAEKNKQVPIGQGDVDWKDFFRAAEEAGLKNYFVEMDPETFAESAAFLKKV